MLRLFRNFSIIPVFLRVFTMVDYWIWANAFSTHCCWWTSSSYCWLTTCPLPVRCPPHLLCLGPSVCVAWWQITAASLQGHPVLWDWRRWDRQVFLGSRCPHSSSTTLCVTVCPCFCSHQTFLYKCYPQFSFVQFSCSVVHPMDYSMPGFPVHHQLPELTQTHVHWVSDAIQPSHPLSSLSPSTFNLSQFQGLFQRVSSSHHVAKLLEFQLQHQSFQWIFRTGFL